ncbi:MAG: SRPBCC domain-containing protein [Cyclobacteriaceae bacterium]
MNLSKQYSSQFTCRQVFEAWISPSMIIPPATKIEVEPIVGGKYHLYAESESATFIMKGIFLEIVPNQKLMYTWQWEGTDEQTVVTVAFSENPNGCTINLEHEGFVSDESIKNHSEGWDSYVSGLEERII